MVQSVRPSSRGLQALLLASNLEAGGARKPIEVEIPPMMEKPRRSILSLPSESPALSYRDPDSETPADKLATELTLSLSLEDLLAEHPRFGLAFDSMRDDEKSNLRMAWADPRAPGGLREMVSACWVQELFDWVLIKNAVLRSDRKKTSRSAASSPAARNHHSGHGNGKQLAMSPGGVMRLPSPALGPLKKSQFTRNDSACSRLLQTMPCGDANPVHARQSLVSADVFVRIQAPGMLSPGQRSRCMSSPTMSADRRISLLPCVASDDVIPEGFNLLGRIEGFHDNSCRVAVGRQYAVGGVSEPVSPVSMGSPACMGNAPNSTEVAAGSPGQARSDQLFRFPSTSSAAAAPFATLPQSLGTKNSYRNGSKGGRSSQPAVRPLVARPDGEEGQGLPPQEICLSYGGPECYPVWAELVASELALLKGRGSGRRGSHRAAESVRNNWFVPVPDLARFISDDRTALPEKESKRKRVMHTPLSPDFALPNAAAGTHDDESMSPVTVPASPIPMVSIEGEPHVGERLRCQHNLSAESQVSWYISDDGWHFTFLRNGLTIRPTADQVHQYLQVEVESNGELHRSRLVFINVSAETDDALRQLIARCTVGRTPAEFSVVVDGSPGLLLLALSPMHVDEDGSIHVIEGQFGSSVVLVLEDGTATVVCEARVADCEWICSSSRSALLTAPGMAAAAMLESPTKTERDGLVLCARLFTALPASLLDYLRTLGSEEAILEEFTKQDSLSSQSNPIAGATPTLLMRTELMQRK